MIHTLSGNLTGKRTNFVVLEVMGIGFKVFMPAAVIKKLPEPGSAVSVFTHLHVMEDGAALYGFLEEGTLMLFEMLISISGIGPKSALGILNIDSVSKIIAAIKEGRAELLTRASGIGRKTAERVILELKGKVGGADSAEIVKTMESDSDIEDALLNLGYAKPQIREALKKLDPKIAALEDRVRAALKLLKSIQQ